MFSWYKTYSNPHTGLCFCFRVHYCYGVYTRARFHVDNVEQFVIILINKYKLRTPLVGVAIRHQYSVKESHEIGASKLNTFCVYQNVNKFKGMCVII